MEEKLFYKVMDKVRKICKESGNGKIEIYFTDYDVSFVRYDVTDKPEEKISFKEI